MEAVVDEEDAVELAEGVSYFELFSEVVDNSPCSPPKLISVPPSPLVPLVAKELKISSNVDIRSPRPEEDDVPPRLLSPTSPPSPDDDDDGPKRDELVVAAGVVVFVEEDGAVVEA